MSEDDATATGLAGGAFVAVSDGDERRLTEGFPNLRQEVLYKQIAQHVGDLIGARKLQPGQKLPPERELARLLGVSRVPIREAMRTLAAQGLVEIRRGHGVFVRADAMDAAVKGLTEALMEQRGMLRELFAVRKILEPASAQWAAAQRSPEQVADLKQILVEMEDAARVDQPDYDRMAALDSRLHATIADASNNRVLSRIMIAIQDLHQEQLRTSMYYRDRVHEQVDEHARVVEAIASADPVEASTAMLEHLRNGEHAAMAKIEDMSEAAAAGD